MRLTLVFISSLVCLCLLTSLAYAYTPWWDSSWPRRIEISIENQGPPLRDYQVLIELPRDVTGALRPIMEGELLSYWLEEPGKVWVKVPYVPEGIATLHIYYGNSEAEDLSSGEATFNFFQDFTSTDSLEGWSYLGGNWTVSGGKLVGSSLKLRESWDVLYVMRTYESRIFEWYGRFKGTYAGVAFIVDEDTFYYVIARIPFYGDYSYGVYRAGQSVELGSAGTSDGDLHLYRLEVAEGKASFYVDGVRQLTFNVSRDVGRFGFILWDGVDSGVEVYWVRVRGYARPEPVVRVGLVEDHKPIVVDASIQSPALMGKGFWVNVTAWDPAEDLSYIEAVISGLEEPIVISWSREKGFTVSSKLASVLDVEVRDLGLGKVMVCLKLALSWGVMVPGKLDVAVKALDHAGLSSSAYYASAITVAKEVYIKDCLINPSYCPPDQLVNVTGYVYFKEYEVPAEGLEVLLEGEGRSLATRTNEKGFFSFIFKAPSKVGKYVYKLKLKEVGEEVLLDLVVDRVAVSWYVDKERPRAGEKLTFVVVLSYEYDGKPVESYEYTVYKDGSVLGTFTEPRFSDVCNKPGLYVYRIVSVVDHDRQLCCFTDPGDIIIQCTPPAYLSTDLLVSLSSGWLSSKVDVEVVAISGGDQDVVVTLYVDGEAYARKTLFIEMAPSKLTTTFYLDPLTIGYKRIKVTVEPVNGVKAIYETRTFVAPLFLYVAIFLVVVALITTGVRRRRRTYRAPTTLSFAGSELIERSSRF
ncbi:MAG: hypothetical protein DRJ97_05015 [Thermoprotei archaeon]|nr:MAG: hypothetical protein DRJ97_05015 [Thermoprotei archaeon]